MAGALSDVSVDRARRDRPDPPLPARIRSTASDVADDVYVTITRHSQTVRRGPCAWSPRGNVLPSAGDPAYVQQAVDGKWLILWWFPINPPLVDQ